MLNKQQLQHFAAQCRVNATKHSETLGPAEGSKLNRIDIYETAMALADTVGAEAASNYLDELAHKVLDKTPLPETVFVPCEPTIIGHLKMPPAASAPAPYFRNPEFWVGIVIGGLIMEVIEAALR